MNKTLIVLLLAVIVLAWNFVFTDREVGLTDQAKVLQGLSTALSYKTAIGKYWTEKKSLPDSVAWQNYQAGISVDLSRTIVGAIEVGVDGPGVISVHYEARPGLDSPAAIDGRKINLAPTVNGDRLEWVCQGTIEVGLLPKNCRPLQSPP